MIEVQMILMGDENQEWLDSCEKGLISPIVNIHKGEGIRGNVNASRMAIWDTCGGDLLSFVNPDDIPTPEAWKKIQTTFDNNPKISGVYTLEEHISASGNTIFLQPDSSNFDPLFGRKYAHHILTVKRNVYSMCRPYIQLYPYGCEWFLAIAAFRMGGLICIPERLYKWRQHKDNIVDNFNHDTNIASNFIQWLIKQDSYINFIKDKK